MSRAWCAYFLSFVDLSIHNVIYVPKYRYSSVGWPNHELCEKLTNLNKWESDVKTNVGTDVGMVKKYHLLRKIGAKRRKANMELPNWKFQKSSIENSVNENMPIQEEKQVENEDTDKNEAADIEELYEESADEYNK